MKKEQLIDGLLEEISKLKGQNEELRRENINFCNQFVALANDVQGVATLVYGLTNLQEMNEKLFANSCGVLSRSLEDISASMEASANGDSFYEV